MVRAWLLVTLHALLLVSPARASAGTTTTGVADSLAKPPAIGAACPVGPRTIGLMAFFCCDSAAAVNLGQLPAVRAMAIGDSESLHIDQARATIAVAIHADPKSVEPCGGTFFIGGESGRFWQTVKSGEGYAITYSSGRDTVKLEVCRLSPGGEVNKLASGSLGGCEMLLVPLQVGQKRIALALRMVRLDERPVKLQAHFMKIENAFTEQIRAQTSQERIDWGPPRETPPSGCTY